MSLRSRPPLLTIGQVVKRSGVAASALRFYEERGLIGSVRVGAGKGHRRYGRSVLRRIAFIVFAQRIGLSLDEVGAELAKLPNGFLTRKDWARLGKEWDARVKARMVELERLRASLTTCIGCGCLSLDVCPLSNPGDRAGRVGAGPRFWLGDKRPAGATGSARPGAPARARSASSAEGPRGATPTGERSRRGE